LYLLYVQYLKEDKNHGKQTPLCKSREEEMASSENLQTPFTLSVN